MSHLSTDTTSAHTGPARPSPARPGPAQPGPNLHLLYNCKLWSSLFSVQKSVWLCFVFSSHLSTSFYCSVGPHLEKLFMDVQWMFIECIPPPRLPGSVYVSWSNPRVNKVNSIHPARFCGNPFSSFHSRITCKNVSILNKSAASFHKEVHSLVLNILTQIFSILLEKMIIYDQVNPLS